MVAKLKRLLVLFLVSAFLSPVSADISLLKPTEAILQGGETIELGGVSGGETIEFLVSRETGSELEWDGIHAVRDSLPRNWLQSGQETFSRTVKVNVFVPLNAEEGSRRIKFRVFDSSQPERDKEFFAVVFVKGNLVSAALHPFSREVTLGEKAHYRLSVLNSSIASHTVYLHSSLPSYWFEPRKVSLAPKELKEIDLVVEPRVYGQRNFSFRISSALNNSALGSFSSGLTVLPTLKSKYEAGFYGFPFFTPNLFPFYLFNSFFSLLVP